MAIEADMAAGRKVRSRWHLPGLLAFRDLRDEALLSACLISAIAAVLAPIMVLAGLKFGFIEILREKLIQDPSFRRMNPVEPQTRPEAFFRRLAERPDVAFVQPSISFAGTSARIEVAAGAPGKAGAGETFDIMPTGAGDPLILEHAGRIPAEGQVTLSAPGAEALDVKAGSTVNLVVTRSLSGQREQQKVALEVVSVLRPAADAERRAYVALEVVQDVERYRSGIPVARRRWLGLSTPPLQSFSAVYLLLDEAQDEVELKQIETAGGFVGLDHVKPEEFKAQTGLEVPEEAAQIVRLATRGKLVRGRQIDALRQRLADRRHWVLPVADDLEVTIEGAPAPLKVATFHGDGFRMEVGGAPLEGWRPWRLATTFAQADRALVPRAVADALKLAKGATIELVARPKSADDATQSLRIPAVVDGIVEGPALVVHAALAGMLLEARNVPLAFDKGSNSLVADDPGFRDFRAYGRSIDDIPRLVRDFRAMGVEVRAKVDAIEHLQRLDSALTWITAIVASVALLGGSCVLLASFYAAVERKKGELSLLRLLGFSKSGIFAMPVLQSLMLSGAGFLLALALFSGFARIINTHFSGDLTARGEICRLEPHHIAFFAAATVLIAVASSVLASRRTLAIDPAEALRQE